MQLRQAVSRSIRILVVLAVIGEFGVRSCEWLFIEGDVGSLASHLVLQEDYFHFRPGTRVVQPERYGDIHYTFNRLGFRGPNPRSDGEVRRILFLGDSVTFGLGVDDDKTFPRRIEEALNQRRPGKPHHEAISLSVFSYAPYHELRALQDVGLGLDPDLIVPQLYMNDFYRGHGRFERSAPPPPISVRLQAGFRLLRDRSALYRRLRQLMKGGAYLVVHDLRRRFFVNSLNDAEAKAKLALFREISDDDDFESFAMIRKLRDLAVDRDLDILVVLTPNEVQLYRRDFDGINTRVRDFCERNRISFYDPLKTFRSSQNRNELFHDGLHLSELGNQAMAEFLVPAILDRLDRPASIPPLTNSQG